MIVNIKYYWSLKWIEEEEAPRMRHSSKLYTDRCISFQSFFVVKFIDKEWDIQHHLLPLVWRVVVEITFKSGELPWKWNGHYFCWGSFKKPKFGLLWQQASILITVESELWFWSGCFGEGSSFYWCKLKIRIAAPTKHMSCTLTKESPSESLVSTIMFWRSFNMMFNFCFFITYQILYLDSWDFLFSLDRALY